ncbi:MAG: class I SAM-dependent methyltransferase [Candidatus Pacearchaeota archaeon]
MRKSNIYNLLESMKNTHNNFSKFTLDINQKKPALRVLSILEIMKNLGIPRNKFILDFGTGFGYGAVVLSFYNNNVVGVEINRKKLREGVRYWKKLGINCNIIKGFSDIKGRGLYFLERDCANLEDFPAESIDLITAFYVSGYMFKGKSVFKNVGRVLKRGGQLIISTEGFNIPFFPIFLKELTLKFLSRVYKIDNVKFKRFFKIDSKDVHDKYIILLEKL